MTLPPLDRRRFQQLAAAAFGGMLAGATGCTPSTDSASPAAPDAVGETPLAAGSEVETHLCRGLNACRGQGKDGQNACAGQGTCASIEHACFGKNECRGQGGCGEKPGLNDCKGQGSCAVPLMAGAWDTVRARLESQWKADGVEFGPAPPAPMS